MLGQFRTQLRSELLFRKPLFLMRVGMHLLLNTLYAQKTSLRTMTIMINSECNCRCQHCFAEFSRTSAGSRPDLSLDEMKAALDEMVRNGVCHFCLQGGEPFLHAQLDEIVEACHPRKSFITIVTNGTVTDEARLREIRDLGVDKIAVSIDSYFPSQHDAFRGLEGCHEKAMATLKVSRKVGLDAAVAVTVLNDTLYTDGVQKLFELAGKDGINIDVNIPQPVGNWDGRTDLLLTDANFSYINNLHKKNVRIRRDLYRHFGRAGCPAGNESLHMSLCGDIYPCVYIHSCIGNIRDHFLKDIRANAMKIAEFAGYPDKCLAGEDRCFIERYISKGFGHPPPSDGFQMFDLPRPPERTQPLV